MLGDRSTASDIEMVSSTKSHLQRGMAIRPITETKYDKPREISTF
jgi:hypothetical protein